VSATVQGDSAKPHWQLAIAEASDGFAAGTLSPVDLVATYLDRIALIDPQIQAFIRVDVRTACAEAAMAAREIAAGRKRGPCMASPLP